MWIAELGTLRQKQTVATVCSDCIDFIITVMLIFVFLVFDEDQMGEDFVSHRTT